MNTDYDTYMMLSANSTDYPGLSSTDVVHEFTTPASVPGDRQVLVYPEEAVSRYMQLIASMPIVILGTIGNALSLIVLCRKRLRRQPSSVFLICVAVSDTAFLYLVPFHNWYLGLTGVFLRDTSTAACKLMRFLLVSSAFSSAWLLVAVTGQRLIAVCFPLKCRRINTLKGASIGAFVILCITIAVPSHFFVTYGQVEYVTKNVTIIRACAKLDRDFMYAIWPMLDLAMYSTTPAILLLLFNIVIIAKIRGRGQLLDRSIQDAPLRDRMRKSTHSLTMLVIMLSLSFCLLTGPIHVYFIGRKYWNIDNNKHAKMKLRLFYTVASTLQALNHACNFIFYCLSGPLFRRELVALFCGKPSTKTHETRSVGTAAVVRDAGQLCGTEKDEIKPDLHDNFKNSKNIYEVMRNNPTCITNQIDLPQKEN